MMIKNMINFLRSIVIFFGGLGLLTREVLRVIFGSKPELKPTINQIYHIGIKSLPLIITTALVVGMVITLQSGNGLAKFGGTLYLPRAVSLSILWELGPLFTGLMVAARAGAGMTSEIGSMMVTQQIDAMRALGTSPIKKIVVPRVIGCFVALPILVAVTDFLGIFGSLVVGSNQFHLDPHFFMQKISTAFHAFDYLSGFSKSFFFSFFISLPACHFGLQVREGAQEVGQATTKSVVVASTLILIGDFFLTRFFWVFS
jgi:phospholipid/cholesterol/gamma-HCH transport system permease protein